MDVMASISDHRSRAWAIARRQHHVVTHGQLVALGLTDSAIKHRVATGRLHRVHRGVYAVGRRDMSRQARWMAAVLACGPGALLCRVSAGALYGILRDEPGPVHVCGRRLVRRNGIRFHRGVRAGGRFERIPVTSPVETLIDLAACVGDRQWEALVNEADSRDLCTPDEVSAVAAATARAGVARVRRVLDPRTFVLTESELERMFLAIARRAGLPKPVTQRHVGGFRVDFHWPALGLVVECDSLRYHRTASKQTKDMLRDQAHAVAGVERLRFSHWQVRHDARHVEATLLAVAGRLAARARAA
jgi:very-short-patch-repair endonuclease